eukprot:372974-Alexandrium_andersonii.AAC.1
MTKRRVSESAAPQSAERRRVSASQPEGTRAERMRRTRRIVSEATVPADQWGKHQQGAMPPRQGTMPEAPKRKTERIR